MAFAPPKKLEIKSDGNSLKFLDVIKPNGKSEVHYLYEYVKSISKKGMLLGLTEKELITVIKQNS